MKTTDLNTLKQEFEQSIKEDQSIYESFEADIYTKMAEICHSGDYLKIAEEMTNDYKCINAYEAEINKLNNQGYELFQKKNALLNNTDFNLTDFIDDNITKILSIHIISSTILYNCSPDIMNFIKNYLIFFLITIASFDINNKYFKSNNYKKRLALKIAKLSFDEAKNAYNVSINNKYCDLFKHKLATERVYLNRLRPHRKATESKTDFNKRRQAFYSNLRIKELAKRKK